MSVPTNSRFSVLQLVGDNQSKKAKKPPETDKNSKKSTKSKSDREKKSLQDTGKTKKDEKPKDPVQIKKQKQLEKKKRKKDEHITEKQWSKWQMKDEALVDDIFEKDLKEAILQSQIEFEGNRRKKGSPPPPPAEDVSGKKAKKAKKVTLQEFMAQPGEQEISPKPTETEKTFSFSEIEERVREIIRKEQYRKIGCSANGPETVLKIDDSPRRDPAQEEAMNRQIEALEASVTALKMDVSEWQMKYEGAAKLLEDQSKLISVQLANPTTESLLKRIDELQRQQVELYHEIGSLHVLLEQERSKNQSDGSKMKNAGVKKSVRFSAA